jgi:mono/diheme cytochrome c family protein
MKPGKKSAWACAAAAVLAALAPAALAQENGSDASPFYLPPGDAKAGREAFVAYRCTTCHSVAGDPELPLPTGAEPAPVLKFGPGSPSHEIAESIIAPSHAIAEGFGKGTPEDVQRSPMRDFSEVMTIRHLRDIVTYLKSQKAE